MPGFILYDGPSTLDGSPILGLAVSSSRNIATGNMAQVYILPRDKAPLEAIRSGHDKAICGTCSLRGALGKARRCYVRVEQGPAAVWRSWAAGKYTPALSPRERRRIGLGRLIRLGAYGDPGAIPLPIWDQLLRNAAGWTGYTHQWQLPVLAPLSRYCMASVESLAEAEAAAALGFRTFRILSPTEPRRPKLEALCPKSKGTLQCSQCLYCDGTHGRAHGNVALPPHGGSAVMRTWRGLS